MDGDTAFMEARDQAIYAFDTSSIESTITRKLQFEYRGLDAKIRIDEIDYYAGELSIVSFAFWILMIKFGTCDM